MDVRVVVGVMGGAHADPATCANAAELGRLIAENGWVLLTGGRDAGVMAAASRGAAAAGGLVVGILPGDSLRGASAHLDIAIPTGMGDARNAINALASHVVVALRGGPGTLSEIALALKSGRAVVTVDFALGPLLEEYRRDGTLTEVATPAEAIARVRVAVRDALTDNPSRPTDAAR